MKTTILLLALLLRTGEAAPAGLSRRALDTPATTESQLTEQGLTTTASFANGQVVQIFLSYYSQLNAR
jgi:hypothetical protein